jgi:hypothetical protein
MASCFKMLSASGSLIAIPLGRLTERLKKHDIKCKKDRFFWTISGNDGDLRVEEVGRGDLFEEFFWSSDSFPHSVLAAIEKEFSVRIVNEYDPRYWGCTSKEELAAKIRKIEQRRNLLGAAGAATDEGCTPLQKRATSSRVRRTNHIVEDRIATELNGELLEYVVSIPPAAYT